MAINRAGKGEDKQASETEETGFQQVSDKIENLSKIAKHPEFTKILEEIVAQPAEKRQEFAEKALEHETLNNKGIRLKGAQMRFKPQSADKKGKTKRIVSVEVVVPSVGTLLLRSKY